MIKFVVISIFLIPFVGQIIGQFTGDAIALANSSFEEARSKPLDYLDMLEAKTLSKPESQISCTHLLFRYKELEKIVEDISWVFSRNVSDPSEKADAHSYINNRLQADPRPIAAQPAYEFKVNLAKSTLNQEESPIEAIAILGATNFDLLFPKENAGSNYKIEEHQEGLMVSGQVNSYDICAKKYIEIFLLRQCPKNETEAFTCGDSSCPPSVTYDFKACKDIHVLRVNLKPLIKKLGLRQRVIKRIW